MQAGTFGKLIHGYDCVLSNCIRLAKVSNIFDIPHIATQQIKFGPIDDRLSIHHHKMTKKFEKKTFSMVNESVSTEL